MISKDGISVDSNKVDTTVKRSRSTNVLEVRNFLGLASYYRRFVEGFSYIVVPLTCLTKKGIKFEWREECKRSFEELKKRFISALILILPSRNEGFAIYNDTSKKWLECVLMQYGKIVAYAS